MKDYKNYQGFKDPEADHSVLVDVRGVRRTETLFLETCHPDRAEKYEPLYTLREQDKDGLPSAYRIFMDSVDEHDAALKLVGSYSHWRKLCSLKWFVEGREEVGFTGLRQWREDMSARNATQARAALMALAQTGNVTAAKALLDEATKGSVGRPRKAKEKDDTTSASIRAIHKDLLGKKGRGG